MRSRAVEKTISLEELVRLYPQTVGFLLERGIRCLACGEPLWGTLESAAQEKGFSPEEIDQLVDDLNGFVREQEGKGEG